MKITAFVLLLTMDLAFGEGVLSSCTGDDICQTIIFNQLAISEIQKDMRTLMTVLKNTTFHTEISEEGTNHNVELDQCLERAKELQGELHSLESKMTEVMSKDQEWQGQRGNLQEEIERLKISKNELLQENVILKERIHQQNEEIKNLTLANYLPADCADVQIQGQTETGIYIIYPYKTSESIEVLCDLESDGGGWTVFFTRQPQDEPVDFNESWENFKNGFGDVNSEYWLGNDLLNVLTINGASSLRIDAEIFSGERRWAAWNNFAIGDEETKYVLILADYVQTSTMGDSLSKNTGSYFTTYDVDNDEASDLNCAVGSQYSQWGKGGWWYKMCGATRPTAPLKDTNFWDSSSWQNWDTEEVKLVSFKTVSMKLRRHNYQDLASMS